MAKEWYESVGLPRINKCFEKYFFRSDSDKDTHELYIFHNNLLRYIS